VTVGDVAITGKGLAGLTNMSAALTAVFTVIDGLTLSGSIDFTQYWVKVVNATTGNTHFRRVDSFSAAGAPGTHTITVAGADVGTGDDDALTVTVYKSQLGYVESIAVDDLSMEVVTPLIVSESDTFVETVTPANAIDFYPQFDLKIDYRALRKDLADTALSVTAESQLSTTIGSGYSVDHRDELGYAIKVALLAQPLATPVYFVPVDLFPDDPSPTGLLEDQDVSTGYTNALEAAETVDVYNVVALNNSAAVQSAVQSHVTNQSTAAEGHYRRGFLVYDVPLGETNSVSGEIAPGRTADGLAPLATEGNKSIKDPNVNFVTGAGVVAGTQVVVTYPPAYAGTYTADGATTDNELFLTGDDWTITKEFAALVDVAYDLNTAGGVHTLEPVAGSPTVAPFTHVDGS
jgi:hypothetical protein